MLKTYRIIPVVFILFLFGFTLITVAPVFAWDKSMGMRHPDRPCMINGKSNPRKGCGPDMRSPAEIASDPYDTGVHSPMPTSTSPSGGEVAQLNAKISELEAGLTELKGVVRALQEQSKNSMQQGAPTAPSGDQVAQLIEKISSTGLFELRFPLNENFGLTGDVRRIWNYLDCKTKGNIYYRQVCTPRPPPPIRIGRDCICNLLVVVSI